MKRTILGPIERAPQLGEFENTLRCLLTENRYRRLVRVAGRNPARVLCVQIRGILRTQRGGDASLGPRRRAPPAAPLVDHQDLGLFGKVERAEQAGRTGTDYQYVGFDPVDHRPWNFGGRFCRKA
jgi:hypothetical protein